MHASVPLRLLCPRALLASLSCCCCISSAGPAWQLSLRTLHGTPIQKANRALMHDQSAHQQRSCALLGHDARATACAHRTTAAATGCWRLSLHPGKATSLYLPRPPRSSPAARRKPRPCRLGVPFLRPAPAAPVWKPCPAAPHLAQQRVQGVLQLHGHPLQGLTGALAAHELQRNGLVLAIHLTRGQLCAGGRQVSGCESVRMRLHVVAWAARACQGLPGGPE
jgi:hypothetical protein